MICAKTIKTRIEDNQIENMSNSSNSSNSGNSSSNQEEKKVLHLSNYLKFMNLLNEQKIGNLWRTPNVMELKNILEKFKNGKKICDFPDYHLNKLFLLINDDSKKIYPSKEELNYNLKLLLAIASHEGEYLPLFKLIRLTFENKEFSLLVFATGLTDWSDNKQIYGVFCVSESLNEVPCKHFVGFLVDLSFEKEWEKISRNISYYLKQLDGFVIPSITNETSQKNNYSLSDDIYPSPCNLELFESWKKMKKNSSDIVEMHYPQRILGKKISGFQFGIIIDSVLTTKLSQVIKQLKGQTLKFLLDLFPIHLRIVGDDNNEISFVEPCLMVPLFKSNEPNPEIPDSNLKNIMEGTHNFDLYSHNKSSKIEYFVLFKIIRKQYQDEYKFDLNIIEVISVNWAYQNYILTGCNGGQVCKQLMNSVFFQIIKQQPTFQEFKHKYVMNPFNSINPLYKKGNIDFCRTTNYNFTPNGSSQTTQSLFFKNLPTDITDETLKEFLLGYSASFIPDSIKITHPTSDKFSRKITFAMVYFPDVETAKNVIEIVNGRYFRDRPISIEYSRVSVAGKAH
jgi:hypothetical protein